MSPQQRPEANKKIRNIQKRYRGKQDPSLTQHGIFAIRTRVTLLIHIRLAVAATDLLRVPGALEPALARGPVGGHAVGRDARAAEALRLELDARVREALVLAELHAHVHRHARLVLLRAAQRPRLARGVLDAADVPPTPGPGDVRVREQGVADLRRGAAAAGLLHDRGPGPGLDRVAAREGGQDARHGLVDARQDLAGRHVLVGAQVEDAALLDHAAGVGALFYGALERGHVPAVEEIAVVTVAVGIAVMLLVKL